MLSDMIAVVQAMDPTTIPLIATAALAAGMYPLGLMLGSSCSPCCVPCGCPVGEELPDAVKVTFSGVTQSALKVSDLLSLSITSCFGDGAAGTVDGTGGLPNQGGPITSVSLTSGGSGYAVLGHVQPTGLSISGGSEEAEFQITLAATTDGCGLPAWKIASVSVTKQAEGYVDGELLSVSLGGDETEVAPAVLTIQGVASQPTLTASIISPNGGNGATLNVSTTLVSTSPDRWGVDSVSVSSGGSGYIRLEDVSFTVQEGGVTLTQATGKINTQRAAPDIFFDFKEGPGSGATFTPIVTQIPGSSPIEFEVSGVTVGGNGTGYQAGRKVFFQKGFGSRQVSLGFQAAYEITAVTAGGAVLSLTKVQGGRYFYDTGIVESVTITNPGSYYVPTGTIGYVRVDDGGKYYKSSTAVQAHAANVTVVVNQAEPGEGSGAEIDAVIDTNVGSPTFGQITGLTIEDGGDDYVKWSYLLGECCKDSLNGWTAFCERTSPTSCQYQGTDCGAFDVSVNYTGKLSRPTVTVNGPFARAGFCRVSFEAQQEDAPFSCEPLDFTAYDVFGGEAHVVAAEPQETMFDYPFPPCCSVDPPLLPGSATSDRQCYNKQECFENGGAWRDSCVCGICSGQPCDEPGDRSLLVTIEAQYTAKWSFNGPWETRTQIYNLERRDGVLKTADYQGKSCYGCVDGVGAFAFFGDGENGFSLCTLYVQAWSEDIPLFFNNGNQYATIRLAMSMGRVNDPLFVNEGHKGIPIPYFDYCIVGGGEYDDRLSQAEIAQSIAANAFSFGLKVTVTLVIE